MRRRTGKYLAFSLYVRNERRCRILAYLYSLHDILRNSGNGNRILYRPLLPQQYGRFVQENGPRDEMVLDRIQRHPGRFPDPGLLCGRFRLDTRIRLADSKQQPLQYAGCGLYHRLRQLLFQCTPADLLDSSLYRTDAFRDCLGCGERYRTGLQDHDATPVLYPGRDVCTLRHAAKCRSGTGVPVQTGFQQADFIRCTECRRAGVLFAESRHGLPYHLLFLFRERHQHVGNSLAGDDHQYFCGSPGRDHDLPGSLQLRDCPIGRRPTGIHHFAQCIRAVTVQQLVVAYFLYLAGDGGTDFYHFLA